MRFTYILFAAAAALPIAFAGCDRYVSETQHTRTDSNGNTQTETKTVRQDNNGNVTVEKQKTDEHVTNR